MKALACVHKGMSIMHMGIHFLALHYYTNLIDCNEMRYQIVWGKAFSFFGTCVKKMKREGGGFVSGYGKTVPGMVWISSFLEKAYSFFSFLFFFLSFKWFFPPQHSFKALNLICFKPPFRNRGETSFDSNSLYLELLSRKGWSNNWTNKILLQGIKNLMLLYLFLCVKTQLMSLFSLSRYEHCETHHYSEEDHTEHEKESLLIVKDYYHIQVTNFREVFCNSA